MKTENIYVANLNEGLCEETIKGSISEIVGVKNVLVNKIENLVTIDYDGEATTDDFTQKLHSIGYREYRTV